MMEPGQVKRVIKLREVKPIGGGRIMLRPGDRVTVREYACFGMWFCRTSTGRLVIISEDNLR